MSRRRVSIFGATGSIGQSTIDLIARDLDHYEVVALTGASNIALLAKDAIRLNAKIAITAHDHLLSSLQESLEGSQVKAAAGQAGFDRGSVTPG